MSPSLTHLNALRAFAAAARLGSFARAAEELGVTPAAVGQQVRILEDFLGRRLFHRTPRGLRATAAASPALAELHSGFEQLEAGFKRLKGPGDRNQISVSVAPTFGWRWLAPRLQGLYEQCPQIDLRMDTSMRLADIGGGEFDIAIRYGGEERNGLKSPVLLDEYILPVCAPSLWESHRSPPSTEDLLSLPLLHVEGETSDEGWLGWGDWGARCGLEGDALHRGVRYPQSAMALQAAFNGQGIAICGLALVVDDLVAGRLVAPLRSASVAKTHYAYRLVYSPERSQSDAQKKFMRWIKREASKTKDLISGFLSGD